MCIRVSLSSTSPVPSYNSRNIEAVFRSWYLEKSTTSLHSAQGTTGLFFALLVFSLAMACSFLPPPLNTGNWKLCSVPLHITDMSFNFVLQKVTDKWLLEPHETGYCCPLWKLWNNMEFQSLMSCILWPGEKCYVLNVKCTSQVHVFWTLNPQLVALC